MSLLLVLQILKTTSVTHPLTRPEAGGGGGGLGGEEGVV
jgi:hypothetical protein